MVWSCLRRRGARDPFFSVQQGRRTADAAGAHFLLLPDAGHFLPQERPNEVATQITALLDTPLEASATRTS
jgi:pimeloyl-ACP methyl ester carboxylesterase